MSLVSKSELKCLVVGCGSIGRRHLRNLRELGVGNLAVCDPDPDRAAPMISELGIPHFALFDSALDQFRPHIVLICTPPALHVPQAMASLRSDAHVFIEKPLSHSMAGVDDLIQAAREKDRVVQVGYNMRFVDGIRSLKHTADSGEIGRVLVVRAEVAQYLPDWRPWQDYRNSYTSKRELGGGILLDGSHEIDYVLWILGEPLAITSMAGRVSTLEVDVEDCANVLLRFASGAVADIHLDFVQRIPARSCRLAGELGTAEWNSETETFRIRLAGEAQWRVTAAPEGDSYMAELQDFISCVAEHRCPLVGLEDGKRVLAVVEVAKREGMSVG